MLFGLSEEIIGELRGVLREYGEIRKAVIFGSRAKGNFSENSDIDLAVFGDDISFDRLMQLNARIEDLELLYKVDVVDYAKQSGTPLAEHIDRVGRIFYEK